MSQKIEPMAKPTVFIVDETLCTACGMCIEACGMKILDVSSGVCVMTNNMICLECGMCLRACPVHAISIEGLDEQGIVEDVK